MNRVGWFHSDFRIANWLIRVGARAMARCVLLSTVFLLMASGCEMDAYFDPSEIGRWERTPVKLPILSKLDVIDEPTSEPPNLSGVRPEDLVPERQDYVIGTGDLITISVYELDQPGLESVQTRQVTDLGVFRHPRLGHIKVTGFTETELEAEIAEIVEQQGHLQNAEVTVLVREGRQNSFAVIAQPRTGGTRAGTYAIFKSDQRLLESMAMAGGVLEQIKNVFIIRQITMDSDNGEEHVIDVHESALDPGTTLLKIIQNGDHEQAAPTSGEASEGQPVPEVLEQSLSVPATATNYVNIDGKWVPVAGLQDAIGSPASSHRLEASIPENEELPPVVQRVIKVPYDLLRKGDLRYNVVIRPGDVIQIPAVTGGFVFVGGNVSRPGTYSVEGDDRRTLKQIIISAGGLNGLGIPERVDLTRRIGNNHEVTVRLNLRDIFNGSEPDFFIKPDDIINIGTNFVATPNAVFRNAIRMSYGFGFVLDKNFASQVF